MTRVSATLRAWSLVGVPLYLSGCGGGGGVDTTTERSSTTSTHATTTSSSHIADKNCCFQQWGDATTCEDYPKGAIPGSGLCNTDWAKTCTESSGCPDGRRPGPAPGPTTTSPPDVKTCCSHKYGGAKTCAGYPKGGTGGHCNTDWPKACSDGADCPDGPVAPPAPPAPTQPTTTTTTTTTTVPACPFYNGANGDSCYAGQRVDAKTQIVCGANDESATVRGSAIFDRATTSCCAQGIRFNPNTQFCCYDGVHGKGFGYCSQWWSEFPSNCYCDGATTGAAASALASTKDLPMLNSSTKDWNVIDTRERPSSPDPGDWLGVCQHATADYGCLNGHKFNYGKQQSCGNWLVSNGAVGQAYGCCPTTGELSPYNLRTDSCCKEGDGTYTVYPGNPHACSCRKQGCARATGSIV